MDLAAIKRAIKKDPPNAKFTKRKWEPVYTAHPDAQILIVGQAPGRIAQETKIPWNDPSGDNLRDWMGIERNVFYDNTKIALVPMDFYFPGSKERGDLPPRKGFAQKWHPAILAQMPHIKLIIVVGQHAHTYYLGAKKKKTLTDTVRAYREYAPRCVPLVHPSPRNNIWQKKNPWFKKQVVPHLQALVAEALK